MAGSSCCNHLHSSVVPHLSSKRVFKVTTNTEVQFAQLTSSTHRILALASSPAGNPPPVAASHQTTSAQDSLPHQAYSTPPQAHDEDLRHFRNGPLPGDLAEIEAFCRIFRVAEQVHSTVMEALLFVNQTRPSGTQPNGTIKHVHQLDKDTIDVSCLEDKVVSVLGCIGALLHQQKKEVLGGRLNLIPLIASAPDSVPPLAQFRAEMQRCCKQLELALSNYFPISNEGCRSMHGKLQKLKNICVDAGYPRMDGSPGHEDIPNWGAVSLHTPQGERLVEQDTRLVLWKGGQPTEEGLQWLIDKGFKAIVDLRAESSGNELTSPFFNAAFSSGQLRHFGLPFALGSSPSKELVLEFAKLASDPQNHPFYFHSQDGLARTFSMAARWREFIFHNNCDKSATLVNKSSLGRASIEGEKNLEHLSSRIKKFLTKCNRNSSNSDGELSDTSSEAHIFIDKSATPLSPYEAQRPAVDLFSKNCMSKFLKSRQISPANMQLNGKVHKLGKLNTVRTGEDASFKKIILDPAGRWGLDGPGIPRAGSLEIESPANEVGIPGMTKGALYRVSELESPMEDVDETMVAGNMCASTTGVVRLQSRKKAEMYLVRTDGFSCTREKVKESTLAFTHPSTQQQMLMWKTAPKSVLLLKKLGNELMQAAQEVASFLHYQEGMNVIVEPEVHDHFARVPGYGFIQTFYSQDTSNLHERVDFVVCLGGDGVILHASNLFRNAVPPVVSFNLGSLGFLTAHPFEDFMQDLRAIIHGNNRVEGVYITLRMRLCCELFRNEKPVPGKLFEVLNEVVLDRGSNPYLSKIECFERNSLITKVQADGVIVATPTGSTAYSTAAGGSMVHPNVPCMLFTPICPHSLSFRPVILPDSALLELKVPKDARSNAWISFDGKKRQQLSRGDSVHIRMSEHPLPTVNKSDQTDDWFRSLIRCLNWNERLEQKRLY